MQPNVTIPQRAPPLLRMLDLALQIGLVALLIYACSRIILPFTGILLWSVILAVMLYPLHLRLVARIGNRWSATADRAGQRRGDAGPDGHRGDVAWVFHIFARLRLAEPQPDRAAAAAVACRPPAGRPETDRDLGARRHQHAGGACQIRPDA